MNSALQMPEEEEELDGDVVGERNGERAFWIMFISNRYIDIYIYIPLLLLQGNRRGFRLCTI